MKHWWPCYELLPVLHRFSTLTSAFVGIDNPYFQKLDDPQSGPALSPLQLLSGFTPWQLLSLKAAGCLCVRWTNSTTESFTAWEGTVLQADVCGPTAFFSAPIITHRPTVHQRGRNTPLSSQRKRLYFPHYVKIFFSLTFYTIEQVISPEAFYP